MKYYTEHTRPVTIPCESGSKFRDIIKRQKDRDGVTYYGKVGCVNTYEKIQAAKDDTLIYNILEKFENGNVEVLNRKNGIYADISGVPRDLNSLYEMQDNISNNLSHLPDQIRLKILNGDDVSSDDIKNYVESLNQISDNNSDTNNGGESNE